MRTMLFLLTFLPVLAFAQQDRKFSTGFFPDSIGCNYISMPPFLRNDFTRVFEVGRRSAYDYIIATDSAYYQLFSRYSRDSLPRIDFAKNELVVHIACTYCAGSGSVNGQPRHRNACSYKDFWCIREKPGAGKSKTEIF